MRSLIRRSRIARAAHVRLCGSRPVRGAAILSLRLVAAAHALLQWLQSIWLQAVELGWRGVELAVALGDRKVTERRTAMRDEPTVSGPPRSRPRGVISTGLVALDAVLHRGGLQLDGSVTIAGRDAVGARSLANHLIASAQRSGKRCSIVQMGGAFDFRGMEADGVDYGAIAWVRTAEAADAIESVEAQMRSWKFGVVMLDLTRWAESLQRAEAAELMSWLDGYEHPEMTLFIVLGGEELTLAHATHAFEVNAIHGSGEMCARVSVSSGWQGELGEVDLLTDDHGRIARIRSLLDVALRRDVLARRGSRVSLAIGEDAAAEEWLERHPVLMDELGSLVLERVQVPGDEVASTRPVLPLALTQRKDLLANEIRFVIEQRLSWQARLALLHSEYGRTGGSPSDRRQIIETMAMLEAGCDGLPPEGVSVGQCRVLTLHRELLLEEVEIVRRERITWRRRRAQLEDMARNPANCVRQVIAELMVAIEDD